MIRSIAATLLFFPLLAAHAIETAAEQPAELASPWVIIGFVVLFVGLCVFYVWLTWRKEKKAKPEPSTE